MFKIIIATLLLSSFSNNEISDSNSYTKLLKELDGLFYNNDKTSENRMNELKDIIELAKKDGYYGDEFTNRIKLFDQNYIEIISNPPISEIWRKDTLYSRRKNKEYLMHEYLAVKLTDEYSVILEKASKHSDEIKAYKEGFYIMGGIPTNIDYLKIISELDLSNDNYRLIFYIHVISFFSECKGR